MSRAGWRVSPEATPLGRHGSGRFNWIAAALLVLGACGAEPEAPGKRVIVLGFDGMDWGLTRQYIDEGRMPSFARLEKEGTARPLGTSVPPLSPIAWSDFITGMDAGGHGIFDFIHRDPETYIPEFAMATVDQAEPTLTLGKTWQIPGAGSAVLNRRGTPFWEALEEAGVETTIVRMPVNYPPSGTATRELAGMGTTDLLGSYGEFSFFTSDLFYDHRKISGGSTYALDLWGDIAEGSLVGPPNPYRRDGRKLKVPFHVYRDPEEPVAKLVIGDEELLLAAGEWSEWVPVSFDLVPKLAWLPTFRLGGMVRFYLRALRPEIELYASPINFDPMAPAAPISHPMGFATELAEATGRYYTQGMPEDTKSLTEDVFDYDEFLSQAEVAGRELEDQYHWVLDRYRSGLLFYYFGNMDQVCHIMMRTLDPDHPAWDPEIDPNYADVVPGLYEAADRIVGHTLERMGPDDTLVVMSDHGFASWRRTLNLNSWLRDEGYLVLKDPTLEKDPGFFRNVDWSRTRAYGAGFHGLYLNLRGREGRGVVEPGRKEALLAEISAKLLAVTDPETGEPAITKVYAAADYYRDRGRLEVGPDLVVGFAKGYSRSNKSVLGELEPKAFNDNTDPWSGDHGMDHETVPGVLFTSRPLPREATELKDLAAAVLAEFGVEGFPRRD